MHMWIVCRIWVLRQNCQRWVSSVLMKLNELVKKLLCMYIYICIYSIYVTRVITGGMWPRDMGKLSALLAHYEGNSPVRRRYRDESIGQRWIPFLKGQQCGPLKLYLMLAWIETISAGGRSRTASEIGRSPHLVAVTWNTKSLSKVQSYDV